MATKYHVQTISPNVQDFATIATRARKDTAIKFGNTLAEAYRVVTDSGTVVYPEASVTEECVCAASFLDSSVHEDTCPKSVNEDCGGCSNDEHCGACSCCPDPEVDMNEGTEFAENHPLVEQDPVIWTGVTAKTGRKWTDLFDEQGNRIAGISNESLRLVAAYLQAQRLV